MTQCRKCLLRFEASAHETRLNERMFEMFGDKWLWRLCDCPACGAENWMARVLEETNQEGDA